jgi:drug/metabolite transporter (DMT)-like permease
MVGSVGPVATIFFGYWFLGEPVSAIQIAGAALVLAGVALVGARHP